jgi:SAM-dependent methyltransferase
VSQSEWVGERSRRWLAELAAREAQLAPVSDALFAAAGLEPGERVLDVGCGPGTTTEPAFRAVQPGGRVTGLDVSPEMIAAARDRFPDLGIDWAVADVVEAELPAQAYDVVLSRFGVMFFSDPPAAFARLAAATRPGGRLCMAVWRRRTESPFFSVPYDAVLADLRRSGADVVEPDPDGSSCSLGAVAPTTELLTAAGWSDVRWEGRDDVLYAGGAGSVSEAAALAPEVGPVFALLEGCSAAERQSAVRAIEQAFAPWFDGRGVALPGGFWIVSARRSATA